MPKAKERRSIKELVFRALLAKALPVQKDFFVVIDPTTHTLLVETANEKQADSIVNLITMSFEQEDLYPQPFSFSTHFSATLTQWAKDKETPYYQILILDRASMKHTEGGTLTSSGNDLTDDDFQAHLDAGFRVTRLALELDEQMSFTLTESFTFKSIKFLYPKPEEDCPEDFQLAAARNGIAALRSAMSTLQVPGKE